MSNAIKAVLLSAFVFPGSGHFFLKKHFTGCLLSVPALASLYLIVSNIVERTLQVSEKIQNGEIQPDVALITELIMQQPAGTDVQLLNIGGAVLMVSWLIGVVDSYRIGRL
ncbi:MAG: hypothetical protein ACN4GW_15340 [Desulforhopalus sp.]